MYALNGQMALWMWPLQVAQWDSQNGIAWEQSTSALDDDLVTSVRKTGLRVVTKLVPSHILNWYCTRILRLTSLLVERLRIYAYCGHRAYRTSRL